MPTVRFDSCVYLIAQGRRVRFRGGVLGVDRELKGRFEGKRELAFYSTLRRTGCQFVDKW